LGCGPLRALLHNAQPPRPQLQRVSRALGKQREQQLKVGVMLNDQSVVFCGPALAGSGSAVAGRIAFGCHGQRTTNLPPKTRIALSTAVQRIDVGWLKYFFCPVASSNSLSEMFMSKARWRTESS